MTLLALVPQVVHSAEDDDRADERLEGLTIDAIDLHAPPRENSEELLALSGLEEGRPFRAAEIRRAVKLIYQLGRFENVYVFGRRVGNLVELQIKAMPRGFVREITVVSQGVLGEGEVHAALGLEAGDELDVETFNTRRIDLATALERIGHRSPAIGIATRRVDANGGAELVVRIDEGPVTRLQSLLVTGTPRLPEWRIRERVGLVRDDVLDLEKVESGLSNLADDYKKRGYLQVKISPPEILDPRGDVHPVADLRIRIDAGPLVSFRFVGVTAVPLRELEAAASELRSTDMRAAALAETKERIVALYERRGYWRAQVDVGLRVDPSRTRLEVIFSVREGPKGRVTGIEFAGNTALDEALLTAKVHQVVAQSLGSSTGGSPADPAEVDAIVGDGSVFEHDLRPRPFPASPDPRRVYIPRAYETAKDALADLYRAAGYQNVRVAAPQVDVGPKGRALHVRFEIEQGIQWRLGAVSFSGNEVLSALELLELSGLQPGEPLSFYAIDSASRRLRARYRDRGHLYARVDEQFRPIVPRGSLIGGAQTRSSTTTPINVTRGCEIAAKYGAKTCPIELVVRIVEGAQVSVRRIIVRGNEHTRDALVNEEMTVEEGRLLRESAMQATQRNLTRLGVFRRVRVHPIDEETEAAHKDVLVELEERKHSSFELGAGVSTEQGVRAFASYGHGNLLGSALRFRADAKVNVQTFRGLLFNDEVRDFIAEQPVEFLTAVGVQYPRIVGLPRGFGLALDVVVSRDNDPAFREDSRQVSLTGTFKGIEPVIFGRGRPVALQVRTTFDRSNVVCNDIERAGEFRTICTLIGAAIGERPSLSSDYLGLLVGASWDLRDDRLNPRKGLYFELLPEVLAGLTPDSPNHVNFKMKINGYLPIGGQSALATSFIFWRIFRLSGGNAELPPNRRLFAGGRSTVRGFQEQTLFPNRAPAPLDCLPGDSRDTCQRFGEDDVSPGGLLFAGIKTEFRFPISSALAGTIFHDFGDLFDDSSPAFSFSALGRQSVGVGVRYATPIGPLLFDVALALPTGQTEVLDYAPHFAAVGSF